MSIFGPEILTDTIGKNDGGSVEGLDLSVYVKKTGVRMTGRINMGNKKITDLADPTDPQDAATAMYVGNYAMHLNNIKLDKSGGALTGDLVMSGNKITDLENPTEDKDAVPKEYVDALVQCEKEVALHAVGRYIVQHNKDNTKTYFSMRAKKNFDLDSGKLIEVSSEGTHNVRPLQIELVSESVQLDNPNGDLKILQYNNSNLEVYFKPPNTMPAPWNFFFLAVMPSTLSTFLFQVNPSVCLCMRMIWNVGSLTFVHRHKN